MKPKNKLTPKILSSLDPRMTQLPPTYYLKPGLSLELPLPSLFRKPMFPQSPPDFDIFFSTKSAEPDETLGPSVNNGELTSIFPSAATGLNICSTVWGSANLSAPGLGFHSKNHHDVGNYSSPNVTTSNTEPATQVYQPRQDFDTDIDVESWATIDMEHIQVDIDTNFSGDMASSNVSSVEDSLEPPSALSLLTSQHSPEDGFSSQAASPVSWPAPFTGNKPPRTKYLEAPQKPRDIQARPGPVVYHCLKCLSPHPTAKQLSRHLRGCKKPFKCQVASCQKLLCDKRGLERHYAAAHPKYAQKHGFATEKAKCPACSYSSLRADNVVRHVKRKHGKKVGLGDLMYE